MLRLILSSLLLAAGLLHAQSDPLVVPLDGATSLTLIGYYGNVEITEGNTSSIRIHHLITVDDAPRPELGKLTVDRQGAALTITEASPQDGDMAEVWSKSSRTVNGMRVTSNDNQHVKIKIAVEVPPGLRVSVDNRYGDVRATDVPGLDDISSTYGDLIIRYSTFDRERDMRLFSNYGDVDLALPAGADADLELETEYGELLTDFAIDIDTDRSKTGQFLERVVGRINGGGAQVRCRAPYDHVYLRTSK
ncbi:hypothetical protein [Lewinella sp. IMCC34183]|uniref:hypothetical protein n=1 Tax=Lewinella sp. IMCC34183 TaxID=2248762 RepID=UPI000E238DE8|nr:hypothetical protein [Lewinella sp. IMCC34183]